MNYEQFREEAIKQLVDELRSMLDQTFEIARQNGKKPARRLKGLKDSVRMALHNLAEQGVETLDINDVMIEIGAHNFALGKTLDTNPAKKASLSSLLRRLSETKDMIIVEKLGEGRRPTQYRFTDEVLALHLEEAGSIGEPPPRLGNWRDGNPID